MFLRALLAFLALPGVVAYLVPLLLAPDAPRDGVWRWIGVLLVAAGSALLLWCVREFYVAGRGTLAPWSPPRELVVSGLYRFSRNPMYVAVLLILFGWALLFRSRPLANYAVLMALVFAVRVRLFEEPFLSQTHGERWVAYRSRVPRWFGRRRF